MIWKNAISRHWRWRLGRFGPFLSCFSPGWPHSAGAGKWSLSLLHFTWAMPPLFWAGSLEQSGRSLTALLPGRSLPGSIIWSRRNKIFENYYDYYLLLMALQEEFESLGN